MTVPASAIEAIWQQHRPTMEARLDLLDRVIEELGNGALADELSEEAADAAHKLAGSVGSFGYNRSSLLARRAEKILRAEGGVDAAQAPDLAELVAGMRADMELEAVVATTTEPEDDRAPAVLPLIMSVASDNDAVEALRVQAGRRGFRVATATNLVHVAERVVRDRPEAVLLDLGCAGGDALDPLEALAQIAGEHPDVPILVTGGDDSLSQRVAAARAGAAGYLEAAATAAEQVDQVALTLQRRPLAGTRVLVVTADGAAARTVCANLTSDAQFEISEEPDAIWDELTRVNPVLLLLDARADGVDAAGLARVLRNDRRWSVLPIVVLAPESDTAAALEAGADDCVADVAELSTRVRSRIERARIHQALAETDMLTGLANRRSSTAALSHLLRLAERLDKELCLAEIDIDHFKRVNDKYGHMAGDLALRRLGELLRRTFRGEDVLARWGGEEFVVAMFGVDRERGIDRMAELLTQWRAETFDFGGESVNLAFSAGVAEYPADGRDLEELFGAADKALYAAKTGGRDQVVGYGDGHRTTQQVDVAIVEDEEMASELIAHGLSERGHRCWRFSNGAGAVNMLGGEYPRVRARVILLDLHLPAVGGLELLTLLGRDGVLRATKVIVVTANDYPQTIAKAMELGAIDYVVKPVTVDDLAERVEAALGRR